MPTWARVASVGGLLLVVWLVVRLGGGTATSLPHLFYLPIVLAVVVMGARGGLATALVATVLCGPLMSGPPQSTVNWLIRGAMFVVLTGALSAAVAARDALYRERVQRELAQALELAFVPTETDDPALRRRVRDVLDAGSFTVVYQPIVSLETDRVVALEALTRVAGEPRRPPDEWFRAAHAEGIGPELEVAAIRKALHGAQDVPDDIEISLNVSAVTLTHPDLPDVLRRAGRPVLLELTEHDVIGNYHVVREQLTSLRGPHVRIAVDDAGAGAASLRHIVQIEPDVIKLDASLSRGVATSTVQRALGRSLVDFAARTGAMLVVEGIEEHDDLLMWRALGADAAQGYVLARPGPIEHHAAAWTAALSA